MALLFMGAGDKVETRQRRKWMERIKKKTFTWLTACVLFCHAAAMQGE